MKEVINVDFQRRKRVEYAQHSPEAQRARLVELRQLVEDHITNLTAAIAQDVHLLLEIDRELGP